MNLYPYYKQTALDIGNTDRVDFDTDAIKVMIMEGYTYDATDKYVSHVPSGQIVARSGALSGKGVTNGTATASNVVLTSVAAGHTISSIIVYKDTGNDATSTLIAHIDKQQDGTTNISLATNGTDVTVSWHPSGLYDI